MAIKFSSCHQHGIKRVTLFRIELIMNTSMGYIFSALCWMFRILLIITGVTQTKLRVIIWKFGGISACLNCYIPLTYTDVKHRRRRQSHHFNPLWRLWRNSCIECCNFCYIKSGEVLKHSNLIWEGITQTQMLSTLFLFFF